LLTLGGIATVPPAGLLTLGGIVTLPPAGLLTLGCIAAVPFAGRDAFCGLAPCGEGLAPGAFLGFAAGRGLPQITQNLPVLTLPQAQVHSARWTDTGGGGIAGRELPQLTQNLPVLILPQAQVQVPAALLSYPVIFLSSIFN
jgi:hypothetical protein